MRYVGEALCADRTIHDAERPCQCAPPPPPPCCSQPFNSTPNDGQTILEVNLAVRSKLLTWMFGRDGGIRTRGLLLPK